MMCRGWQEPHRCDKLLRVTIAYLGAFSFPARYSMCDSCVSRMQAFVDRLVKENGPGAVRFEIEDESR